jgi:hypothetical protein
MHHLLVHQSTCAQWQMGCQLPQLAAEIQPCQPVIERRSVPCAGTQWLRLPPRTAQQRSRCSWSTPRSRTLRLRCGRDRALRCQQGAEMASPMIHSVFFMHGSAVLYVFSSPKLTASVSCARWSFQACRCISRSGRSCCCSYICLG